MDNLVSLVLSFTILMWAIFQPSLYMNAMLVEEAIANVVYETQKEASLQGRYTEDLYDKIIDELGTVHKFDESKVTVQGTETLTNRGDRIMIEVTVPKPPTNVFKLFETDTGEYKYKKYILSEYAS